MSTFVLSNLNECRSAKRRSAECGGANVDRKMKRFDVERANEI
jgi:hypothetical protein